MIDSWMVRQIQPTLNQFALDWVPKWLRANAVTVMGFLVGLLVLPLLQDQAYLFALIVILVNRFLDGLDLVRSGKAPPMIITCGDSPL